MALPDRFTFPFYYQPHPLARIAIKELQAELLAQSSWHHNFFPPEHFECDNHGEHLISADGKMFGVLIVKSPNGELGYFTAFSGKLAGETSLPQFVPPVFDLLDNDSFFLAPQKKINAINKEIVLLESNPELLKLKLKLSDLSQQYDIALEAQRDVIIRGRQLRKEQREKGKQNLSASEFSALSVQLSKKSVEDKNTLKYLKANWQEKIALVETPLKILINKITLLKAERKNKSSNLQQQIFEKYQFLNIQGQFKNITDIFSNSPNHTPPSGAGECAAPKLLHFAFKHKYTPIAMAEFWWGASPKSEVRRHKHIYPACQSKCQPILLHMLDGMLVDDNPLLLNPAEGKQLDIIYEDSDILVINKPADFLSVPGKNIADSVYSRIKQAYPLATGPLIVHRLDMSTSGLMVIALTKAANKALQQQFIKRTVKKRYIALLEGTLTNEEGTINLPLCLDYNDRPRQMVCTKNGKPAETYYQVIERKDNRTKVYFYPKTGRTHQLRVHAAHALGLNSPIVGDDHYGLHDKRLHLHAQQLSFIHPETNEPMSFECDPDEGAW